MRVGAPTNWLPAPNILFNGRRRQSHCGTAGTATTAKAIGAAIDGRWLAVCAGQLVSTQRVTPCRTPRVLPVASALPVLPVLFVAPVASAL